jgi:beta-lactam-binding protein with PASTA domain
MRLRGPARDIGETTTQVIDGPTASHRLPPETEAPSGAPLEEPPPDRFFWPWLLVLLVLVVAGGAGAWLASRHDGNRRARPATTAVIPAVSPAPKSGSEQAREPRVPRLVGLKAPAALAKLRRAGLAGGTRGVFSPAPRNVVVGQRPAPETTVADGSTVTLSVSKGPRPVPVPDVTGQQVGAALETVKAQGLKTRIVRVPSNQPAGQVVAQHPEPGAVAAVGSSVRLNVSGGQGRAGSTEPATTAAPASVTIPDVGGQRLSAARKTIRGAGLVTEVRRVPSRLPKNTVVAQSPVPGTTAKPADHVLVTVSLGSKKHALAPAPSSSSSQVSVPDVVGEDEETAGDDLQAAGFEVDVVDRGTTDAGQDGDVVEQSPTAGAAAQTSSTVTIYVGRFGG